jgi:hypothetical protein
MPENHLRTAAGTYIWADIAFSQKLPQPIMNQLQMIVTKLLL